MNISLKQIKGTFIVIFVFKAQGYRPLRMRYVPYT